MHGQACYRLLIVHQDQLEAELAGHMNTYNPSVIGNDYIVVGTMERAAWRMGTQQPVTLAEMLKYVADFKDVLNFEVGPAGWYKDGE